MTDLSDRHLPEGAHRVVALEASVGRGYIAESAEDVIYLNVVDPQRGPYTIIMPPALGCAIAAGLADMWAKLDTLTHLEEDGDLSND